MATRRCSGWVLGWMGFMALAATASAQQMRIRVAVPVEIGASPGVSHFDAFGRRFDLSLQKNDRLLKALPASQKLRLSDGRLLRGWLENVPGSWVRLARVGAGLEGAIWDGHELYGVARYGQIAKALMSPLDVASSQTVLYRFSDTFDALPAQFCPLDTALPRSGPARRGSGNNALTRFQALISELRANALETGPAFELPIALIADAALQTQLGADTTDVMLARLNIADGIFAGQVGVFLVPTTIRLVPVTADPFTATQPGALLDQVANYREADPAIRAAGLAHLMTGKFLESTAGLANMDALCDTRLGVSLGVNQYNLTIDSVVLAHELGHNFGAPHDGVDGPCKDTPKTFVMQPNTSFATEFSQCSVENMQHVLERARGVCLTPALYADVAVELPASPHTIDTRAIFTLPVTVSNPGNVTTTGVTLAVQLPSSGELTVESPLPAGNCSVSDHTVNCALGNLASEEVRTLPLRLSGTTLGPLTVSARVDADNDRISRNDEASVQLGLPTGVDLGVALAVSPADAIYVGDTVEFTMDVLSRRGQPTSGAILSLDLDGIPVGTITAAGHACAIDAADSSLVNCQLADLAANSTTRIVVRGQPAEIAHHDVKFSLKGPSGDPFVYDGTAPLDVLPEQVQVAASLSDVRAIVGAPFEITYTLTAIGRDPFTQAAFLMDTPWQGTIEAVTPATGSCTPVSPQFTTVCDFGILNPGESRSVVVRAHWDSPGPYSLTGRAQFVGGGYLQGSSTNTAINSLWRIDAGTLLGTIPATHANESGTGTVSFQSRGADAAHDVVITLDLPAPAHLTGFALLPAGSDLSCSIVTAQQLGCTGSFSTGTEHSVLFGQYTFESDAALDGAVTVKIVAAGDGNPDNDSATTALRVLPQELTDVRLSVAASSASAKTGSQVGFPLVTVTNGVAEARNVTVKIPVPDFAKLRDVSSSGICQGTAIVECTWTSLAPGASATVEFALLSNTVGSFTSQVTLTAANDSNTSNNASSVSLNFTASQPGNGSGSSGGGKKGGGAFEGVTLLALALLLARRFAGRRHHATVLACRRRLRREMANRARSIR